MIKTDEQYKLEVGVPELEKLINKLEDELATLDPSAVYEARMIAAQLHGVINYMKG